MTHSGQRTARLVAGIPAVNLALYHRIRFSVGDPAAVIDLADAADDGARSIFIVRDIEMQRARAQARADRIASPGDFEPAGGLSGDREIATAQATAECLQQLGVTQVIAHRSLPLIFAHEIEQAGIAITCDAQMGVMERRAKDEQEVAWLRAAQQVTEGAVQMACETIAHADAQADGVLQHDGEVLTSERVRVMIDTWLLQRGYSNPELIVAGGTQGGDCHEHGSGPLRTEEPIIIDVFPRNRKTLYNGDCTRTVVHGAIPAEIAAMHAAVVDAKAAAIAATRAGITGEAVHDAAARIITQAGYSTARPGQGDRESDGSERAAMTHGTGHGVGLEVHEPPLLDRKGPPLVAGDCLTIEPGLYHQRIGGVRVEDMVIVQIDGCMNLNSIPAGLTWR